MESVSPVVIDSAGTDIHAEGARIRAHGPVSRVLLPGGVLAWSITGYEAAKQALADQRFSKDPRKHWTAYSDGEIGPDFPLIAWARMDNLTTSHGEAHSRLRRLVATAFTPRRVSAMRPSIEDIAAELLDRLGEREAHEVVDLKATFSHPLAAQVIGALLGVPQKARVGILSDLDAPDEAPPTPEQVAAAFEEERRNVQELIAAKRRTPGDDLTTDLLAAQEEDGSRLTDDEVTSMLLLLLNTGTEPLMNLVTNAVAALLTRPDQRELVRSGQVSWDHVIEETLRVDAPVAHLPFRFAVEDVELGGVTIAKGDPVLVNFAAAGRDPQVHGASADRYDLTRPTKAHISFGHGIYRCIGSALAWLEAEVALEALFTRFPGLTLAVAPERLEPQGTFIMNGRRVLPVRLTADVPTAAPR